MMVANAGLADYYQKRFKESSFKRAVLLTLRLLLNVMTLRPLLMPRPDSNVKRLVDCRPEIYDLLVTRFVARTWNTRTRVARFVDHCETVESIGGVVDFRPDTIVDLISLDVIDPRYRMTLDQARWQLSEGQMVFSLWEAGDRIYSISFCFATEAAGRVVYVGGMQGARLENVLDKYREFTRLASGMRPRDFLVEMFKSFCRALDVHEIRAVSDANHVTRIRFMGEADPTIKLSYDEIWSERGGVNNGDGFFVLTTAGTRRSLDNIPSKKRSTYRKRYMMLDRLEAKLFGVLHGKAVTHAEATLVPSISDMDKSLDDAGCVERVSI